MRGRCAGYVLKALGMLRLMLRLMDSTIAIYAIIIMSVRVVMITTSGVTVPSEHEKRRKKG